MAITADQQSAQDWINNSASGQGGMDNYVKTQTDRYNQAVQSGNTDLINRLNADAQRVGYSLPAVNSSTPSVVSQINTGTPQTGTTGTTNSGSNTPASSSSGGTIYRDGPANWQSMGPAERQAYIQSVSASNAQQLASGSGSTGSSSVPSQLNASARVNSADWLNNPDWQGKLREMQSNPSLAQAELNRVKGMYNSATSSGADANRLQQIRTWADQVRQAAGISANDPFYGNGATPNADGTLSLEVNNQQKPDVQVYQGTSYDSAAKIAQALGVSYSIDPKTGMPIIGGKQFNAITFDANGNPEVPTSLVAQALGFKVQYDDKNKTVVITGERSNELPQPNGQGQPGTPGQPNPYNAPNFQPTQVPDYLTPLIQAMPQAPTYTPYQSPDYMSGLLAQMPTMPTLSPYQAPDLSGYYSHLQQLNPFTGTMDQFTQQAHNQIDPNTQMSINGLMQKQGQDIASSDVKMNQRGIWTSGIAQQVENDIRAKTSDAVAKVFMNAQAQISKVAQQLYTNAFNEWSKGNDQALKNNQMWLTQAQNASKEAFTQWLQTQQLSLSQYKYALDSWDKMAVMVQKDAQQQASDYFNNQKNMLSQYNDSVNAWGKLGGFMQGDAKMNVDNAQFYDKLNSNIDQFNSKMNWDQNKFNNLSADQAAQLQQKYDQMGQDWQKTILPYQQLTQFQQGQLNQGQQKIDIQQAAQQISSYFKQLGYDLDVNKLQEAIRHNQASEGLAAQKLTVDTANNQRNFDEKVRMDNANIDKANAQLTDTAKRTQLDGLKSELNSTAQRINSFVSNNQQVPQTLVDNYNQIKGSIESVIGSAGITTTTGTSDGNFDANNHF
jgi:hypothetical protein